MEEALNGPMAQLVAEKKQAAKEKARSRKKQKTQLHASSLESEKKIEAVNTVPSPQKPVSNDKHQLPSNAGGQVATGDSVLCHDASTRPVKSIGPTTVSQETAKQNELFRMKNDYTTKACHTEPLSWNT